MSLLNEINQWYKNEKYPPDGPDLDYILVNEAWVKGDTVTELVSSEDNDTARWGTWFTNVYKRDEDLVAVTDIRPATEMQDWGDYGEPEIYPVTAHTKTVTITEYRKA